LIGNEKLHVMVTCELKPRENLTQMVVVMARLIDLDPGILEQQSNIHFPLRYLEKRKSEMLRAVEGEKKRSDGLRVSMSSHSFCLVSISVGKA
jgi:hypothetical protein